MHSDIIRENWGFPKRKLLFEQQLPWIGYFDTCIHVVVSFLRDFYDKSHSGSLDSRVKNVIFLHGDQFNPLS